jgi:hypothetical protein
VDHGKAMGHQGIVEQLPVAGQKSGGIFELLIFQVFFAVRTQCMIFPGTFAFARVFELYGRKPESPLSDQVDPFPLGDD